MHTLTLHCTYYTAWDNLPIGVFGFKLLCKDFFNRYPRYYLVPLFSRNCTVQVLEQKQTQLSTVHMQQDGGHSQSPQTRQCQPHRCKSQVYMQQDSQPVTTVESIEICPYSSPAYNSKRNNMDKRYR